MNRIFSIHMNMMIPCPSTYISSYIYCSETLSTTAKSIPWNKITFRCKICYSIPVTITFIISNRLFIFLIEIFYCLRFRLVKQKSLVKKRILSIILLAFSLSTPVFVVLKCSSNCFKSKFEVKKVGSFSSILY